MADHQIENVHDLLEAVDVCGEAFDHSQMMWRGHARNDSWLLRPKVFRTRQYDPKYEGGIARRFVDKAQTRHSKCPDRTEVDSWLFLMQHYGLPTRLLDWTESVLIAAYFVVRDDTHIGHDGTIWALAPGHMNENQTEQRIIHGVSSDPARRLFAGVFDLDGQEPEGPIIAVRSAEVDVRMMVQQAAFTIHGSRTAIDELPANDTFLKRFTVPAKAKPHIKGALRAFGYSEANLFPDLEHLAKELSSLNFK